MLKDDLALTFLKGIGTRTANLILEYFGSAETFFRADSDTCRNAGLHPKLVSDLPQAKKIAFEKAETELRKAEEYGIEIITRENPDFPQALTLCADAPILIYGKGKLSDINRRSGIAVVGTRRASLYGKEQTCRLVEGFKADPVFIVSGLATGIDTQAHRCSLDTGLPTIAVLAHGLEKVYPEENTGLAREIVESGGAILSEMPLHTRISAGLFPRRNRIIAGMAEATVIAEASMRGGAMRTAYAAESYQRTIFAVPGRNDSYYFEGCNYLIRTGKAILLQSAGNIRQELGWPDNGIPYGENEKSPVSSGFTPDFDQAKILQVFESENPVSGDVLQIHTGLAINELLPLLLKLEMAGIIRAIPGNRYERVGRFPPPDSPSRLKHRASPLMPE